MVAKRTPNTWYWDRYSLAHAAVGALFEASRIPAIPAIGSHIVFEAVEDSLKRGIVHIWPDATPDSMKNHIGDVAAFTAGYFATRALKKSSAGMGIVAGFVGAAAAVWMWNLMSGKSWLETD